MNRYAHDIFFIDLFQEGSFIDLFQEGSRSYLSGLRFLTSIMICCVFFLMICNQAGDTHPKIGA